MRLQLAEGLVLQPIKHCKWLSSSVCLLFSVAIVSADTFTRTYSGTLSSSTSVVEENVTLSTDSALLLDTTSYGGGANASGTSSAAGGFQPSVTLYTGAGLYVDGQQASSPVAQTDPTTGLALDSYLLESSLPAGSYVITLTNWATQQSPTATNLSDGFTDTGDGTFADVSTAARSGAYSLNVAASAAAAAVPEPSSAALTAAALGLALLAGLRARSKRIQSSEELQRVSH